MSLGQPCQGIVGLNSLPQSSLQKELLTVCGCQAWVESLSAMQPFASAQGLHAAANQEWWRLSKEGWLEAFAAHPRIGDRAALAAKFSAKTQEAEEQAGAAVSSDFPPAALRHLLPQHAACDAWTRDAFVVCREPVPTSSTPSLRATSRTKPDLGTFFLSVPRARRRRRC